MLGKIPVRENVEAAKQGGSSLWESCQMEMPVWPLRRRGKEGAEDLDSSAVLVIFQRVQ